MSECFREREKKKERGEREREGGYMLGGGTG